MEFFPEEGISDEEAVQLLESEPPRRKTEKKKEDQWSENNRDTFQSLRMDEEIPDEANDDPFTAKLMGFEVGKLMFS